MSESIEELASHCIRCGFCLESCPTYRLTGSETESPRGRIYLARSAAEGRLDWLDTQGPIDRCLGCRACEPACPSGVQYGRILELARDRIEESRPRRSRSILLEQMTDRSRLRGLLRLARAWPGTRMPTWVSPLVSGRRAEADLPQRDNGLPYPALDETSLPSIKGVVYLLEGCAMGELFPGVHESVRRLLRRVGYRVEPGGGCCGALHAHNGHLDRANELARRLESDFSQAIPIVVDSAGCGAWMKEAHVGRVFDVSEFLWTEGLEAMLKSSEPFQTRIAYHDACHLAHGQGIRDEPRGLLAAIPGVVLVPLSEADMCCGSAGVYNLFEPTTARQLLDRKWANVEASNAEIVALGNPGCHAWIAQASRERGSRVKVLHTAEVLEAALSGLDPESLP